MFRVGDIGWHRFARKRWEDIEWSEENQFVKLILESKLREEKWDKGIILVGNTGVGKTLILVQLYKNRYFWFVEKGNVELMPIWFDWADLLFSLRAGLRSGEIDLLELDARYVFVDDVPIGVIDWEVERRILSYFLIQMYRQDKILVMTSNFHPDTWDIDERAKDRIFEMCMILTIEGKSKRREVL